MGNSTVASFDLQWPTVLFCVILYKKCDVGDDQKRLWAATIIYWRNVDELAEVRNVQIKSYSIKSFICYGGNMLD